MTIWTSVSLQRELHCPVSPPEASRENGLESWNADSQTVQWAGRFALLAHDRTLMAIIVPLKGVRSYEGFLERFLDHGEEVLRLHGTDLSNVSVLFAKRRDRRIIGTMNDMWGTIRAQVERQLAGRDAVDWRAVERSLHQIPYSLIEYRSPARVLQELIARRR